MSNRYVPPAPKLGDNRYKKLPHKELLDYLRIRHYNYFGSDPSIQWLRAEDGYGHMFENGRFIPTEWYSVRGSASYIIQFSSVPGKLFTGSILITTKINEGFSDENFSCLDVGYISLLRDYIKDMTKGDIDLILSDGEFKTISFGRVCLPSMGRGDYYNFVDCATEVLASPISSRNIIYIGEDIKKSFLESKPDEYNPSYDYNARNEEIIRGDKLIISCQQDIIRYNEIKEEDLNSFNDRVKQLILKK